MAESRENRRAQRAALPRNVLVEAKRTRSTVIDLIDAVLAEYEASPKIVPDSAQGTRSWSKPDC